MNLESISPWGWAFPLRPATSGLEWTVSEGLVPYPEAVKEMEARVAAIAAGEASERVWLLQHAPIYTAGTSARAGDLIQPGRLPVWMIATISRFGVTGERRRDRVGVWVKRPDKPLLSDGRVAEDKIAAIGVRVRRWIAFHGVSLNFDPDLRHYAGIVPCGIADHGVTSLAELGVDARLEDVDCVLREEFERRFEVRASA
jgi:lipoyl(octanoyl) transferase